MPESSEQEVLAISRRKWEWMAARAIAQLEAIFHDSAAFVHMGATFDKQQELEVIRSGDIRYRSFDITDVSVRVVDATAVVLTTMRLGATVGGEEVSNPFVTTEVYVSHEGRWLLLSLAFTRLLTR